VGFIRLDAAAAYAQLEMRVNGANDVYSYHNLAGAATNYLHMEVSQLVQLSANDYIDIAFQQSNCVYYGGARELQFYGYLVS